MTNARANLKNYTGKPFVLGVCGGSGSGKTYFAHDLLRLLGEDHCAILLQDSFYFDQSAKFDKDGGSVNYDHPSAIEFAALSQCLSRLKAGQNAEVPIYNFETHSREPHTILMNPRPIIIVDGILILHSQEVRDLLDRSVYFATSEELRYARRLARDVAERGRTPDGVRAQFEAQVKPMHDLFVEPSRIHANWIAHDLGDYDQLVAEVMSFLTPALPDNLLQKIQK